MVSISPTPRAPRYDIRVPVRYRAVGQSAWLEGTTENISRSGVLFRASSMVDVSTSLEMDLRLSAAPPVGFAADLRCVGRVVRAVPEGDDDTCTAIAVAITDCQFVRAP